jgi:hypothetical protein
VPSAVPRPGAASTCPAPARPRQAPRPPTATTTARSGSAAQHEIAHTLGVGTYGTGASHVSGGRWTGSTAIARLRSLTGNSSADDYVANIKLVAAPRTDMGL